MKHPEFELQKAVCNYLRLAYPSVLFDSDTIANVKLTAPQQARNKAIQKEGFKRPDMCIYFPTEIHSGLFIELKVESPYKKDGTLKSGEHLRGQYMTMKHLEMLGYKCSFAWTFEMAKEIIDNYLQEKL